MEAALELPMEPELTKKCFDLVQKGIYIIFIIRPICISLNSLIVAMEHSTIRCGLKEVEESLAKNEPGIVLLAADVTPAELIMHIPVECKKKNIPYTYIPCRQILGAAVGKKWSCITAMIVKSDYYKEEFEEVLRKINELQ